MSNNDIFANTTKFYVMANITDDKLCSNFEQKQYRLLDDIKKNNNFHITLFNFYINANHPYSNIFKEPTFLKQIRNFYDQTLIKNKTMLLSKNNYDILGKNDNKYFSKIYGAERNMDITDFRMMIYKYIEELLNHKATIKKMELNDGNTYYLFYYIHLSSQALIAVPEFNFGKGNWTPHVSIISTYDLAIHNEDEYYELIKIKSPILKTDYLFKKLRSKTDITDKIILADHASILTISMVNSLNNINLKI